MADNSHFALVTGGNGWLGKRLVAALLADNRHVRCLVPAEEAAKELARSGVEIVRGDVRSADARAHFLRNSEGATLYHLAGVIHPPGCAPLFDAINHRAAIAMVDEGRKLRRIVVMSSNSPIGCNPNPDHLFDENSPYNPYMGYGKSKMMLELALLERIAKKDGAEIVIIRAPWFYGPGQPPRQTLFFRMIRNGKMPIFGNGRNKRSMAYTDSLANGLMLAAYKPEAAGEIFWIADARPYTMNEIIGTVADVLSKEFGLGVKGNAQHVPGIISDVARIADATLQSAGLYHQKIHVLSEMNQTIACHIGKAQTLLGYQPQVELREGMRRSIGWCLDNGHKI
jgi:nucleoside-diphosphate-sugar epimerase